MTSGPHKLIIIDIVHQKQQQCACVALFLSGTQSRYFYNTKQLSLIALRICVFRRRVFGGRSAGRRLYLLIVCFHCLAFQP